MKFKSIGLFIGGLVVGCLVTSCIMVSGDDTEVVENSNEIEVAETIQDNKRENKEIQVNKKVMDNEYVEVVILSKVQDDTGIGYKVQAKNKTDKNLSILSTNMSFNDKMATDIGNIGVDLLPNTENTQVCYLTYFNLDCYKDITSIEDLDNAKIEFELFENGNGINETQVIVKVD